MMKNMTAEQAFQMRRVKDDRSYDKATKSALDKDLALGGAYADQNSIYSSKWHLYPLTKPLLAV